MPRKLQTILILEQHQIYFIDNMGNLDELLAKRHTLYVQLSDINNQIEEYYNTAFNVKVGDLFYDDVDCYFYLVINTKPEEATILEYPQDSTLGIGIEFMEYPSLAAYKKVSTDNNVLENVTSQLLNIKNGKELQNVE